MNCSNQESASEAVNAYYGVALLGDALDMPQMRDIGRYLTAQEIRGLTTYWQSTTSNSVYPQPFADGKCIGMLWQHKVVDETFFASGKVYTHGISILPITPISELYLRPEWVREEDPVVMADVPNSQPPAGEAWLGFFSSSRATIDPERAWNEILSYQGFDNGATRANMLWWIATRPKAAS